MSAYIVANISVTDPDAYAEYSKQVQSTLEPHGGRFLVRGGEPEALEGEWLPRVVVLEFPGADAARAWYASPEYQRILPIRRSSSDGRLVLVQGYEG